MPNILFASNNLAHWPNSVSSSNSATYDDTRVPYSIVLSFEELMTSPVFVPAAGDVTWLHCRTYMSAAYISGSALMFKAYDVNGNALFSIYKVYNQTKLLCQLAVYNGSGDVTNNQTFVFNKNRINNLDFRYEATATLLKVEMFINGGLAAVSEQASNPSGFDNPAYFTVGAALTSSPSGLQMYSEFIVADGDTRNARMNLLRPVAEGGETDWVGPASNLADDDPTTGITTILANQRHSLTLEAYTGASNVSAVVIATQSLAGAGAPQNLRHSVRMSTVNYDGPTDLLLDDVLKYHLTDFKINPGTSVPWVGSDLSSMEMGFVSKT